MSSEAIALWTETSSDPELIAGVRAGDTAAFGVLYERHVDASRKVAAMYTNTAADIDDVVSESFSRVLRALQRGDGPDLAFRAYLFTIVRRTGMDIINKGIRTKPRDDMGEYEANIGYGPGSDEPAIEGFEHGMVADAFKSLPERWQAVLWYTEVEKKSPREIAPLLGLSANGVAALSYRAREALRQAYLQQHLNVADTVDCLEANTQLGAYVRGGLNKREQAMVGDHVKMCQKCGALVAELEDVNRGMRSIIAPLVLGAAGMGALQGGLPIGGAFGPSSAAGGVGAGTGAAGAGGSAGAGGAAGVAATTTATGVSTTFAATGATAAGVNVAGGAGATLTSGGFASALAGIATIALPTVAIVAVVALAVNAAGVLGFVGNDPQENQGQEIDSPAQVDSPGDPEGTSGDDPVTDPDDPSLLPGDDPSNDDPNDNDVSPNDGSQVPGASDGTPETDPSSPDSTNSPANPRNPSVPADSTDPKEPADSTDPTDPADPTDPTDLTDPTEETPVAPRNALLSFSNDFGAGIVLSRTSPVISITLDNAGPDNAKDVEAIVALPAGLSFDTAPAPGGAGSSAIAHADRLAATLAFAVEGTIAFGDWDCAFTDHDGVATCALEELAVGDSSSLELPLATGGATNTHPRGSFTDKGKTVLTLTHADVSESFEAETSFERVDELNERKSITGNVAATQVGAPLMSCDLDSELCRLAMNSVAHTLELPHPTGALNNNHWGTGMRALNEAGGVKNSGTTYLDIPAGSTILYASLEWSANKGRNDVFDPEIEPRSARLKAPGATDFVSVTADSVDITGPTESSANGPDSAGRTYYQSRLDITSLVSTHGAGEWSLADIALPQISPEPDDPTYYGGFTITVIYEHSSLPEAEVTIFEGSKWIASEDTGSSVHSFVADDPSMVTVGWVAWEGDRATTGDRLSINGFDLQPLRWNPGGNWPHASTPSNGQTDNAADATAFGSKWANTLGVDAKPFKPHTVEKGDFTVTASTTGDQYLIGSLTVTIVPD